MIGRGQVWIKEWHEGDLCSDKVVCILIAMVVTQIDKMTTTNSHWPDNHDGVITLLEPDILESEVRWALGSITTNKARRGDEIPAELFQILKDDAVKS